MRENILIDKTISFAARIIKLNQYLIKDKKEHIISKQIVRSGTSIGANINEANYGQSKADFIAKLHIALKKPQKRNIGSNCCNCPNTSPRICQPHS